MLSGQQRRFDPPCDQGFDFILHLVRVVRCKFGVHPGRKPLVGPFDRKRREIRRKKSTLLRIHHLGRDQTVSGPDPKGEGFDVDFARNLLVCLPPLLSSALPMAFQMIGVAKALQSGQ